MSKEEENLFSGVSLEGTTGPDQEKEIIDASFFEKEPEERNKVTNTEEGKEKPKKEEPKEEIIEEDENSIDATFFEKENQTKDITSSNDDPPANTSSSPLQLVTKTLLAEGLITLDEDKSPDDISSAEELVEGFRKKLIENEYTDLTEEQKLYLDSVRNGIPDEVIKQNFNNIKALDKITPDSIEADENLRGILITQNFIAKGLSEEEAAKQAKRSIELGEDTEDAKSAFTSLREIESKRLKEENDRLNKEKEIKEKENLENLSKLKETILNKEEFVPGIKVNSTTKQKIFDNMTKVVGYDPKGNGINAITQARLKEPEKFAEMDSFFYTITNGYKDFSKFTNSVKTSAIEELDKQLKTNNTGGGTPKSITSSKGNGLADALKKYKV